MTCFWNGLRTGLRFPVITIARIWRGSRRRRASYLDPRLMSAHWRRDLGFDV